MINRNEKICPRCDAPTLKSWNELDEEEKDMVKRLAIKKVDRQERQKHRYCTRCWFVDPNSVELA